MKNHPLKQRIGKFFQKFFLIDDTPHKIAAGAALGMFWGIMPGEGVVTTLVTASILRFNRLSATAGVLATNMWTTVAVLPFAATIGGWIFGTSPSSLIDSFKSTYHLGLKYFFTESILNHVLLPLIVGFLIASIIISLIFYLIVYFLLKYRKMKLK